MANRKQLAQMSQEQLEKELEKYERLQRQSSSTRKKAKFLRTVRDKREDAYRLLNGL